MNCRPLDGRKWRGYDVALALRAAYDLHMNTKPNPKKVRQLRIEKGFSQEQLAEMAKVGHRTIQRIERARPARPSTLAAVASALGVGATDIAPSISSAPFGASLAEERRAMDARLAAVPNNAGALAENAKYRVEVVEVAPTRRDDETFTPVVVSELAHRLGQLGFKTSVGAWDSNRLLAKLPPDSHDTIYVIHAADPALATRICETLDTLRFDLPVKVLKASEASAKSNRIPTASVVEYHDLLIAYCAAV